MAGTAAVVGAGSIATTWSSSPQSSRRRRRPPSIVSMSQNHHHNKIPGGYAGVRAEHTPAPTPVLALGGSKLSSMRSSSSRSSARRLVPSGSAAQLDGIMSVAQDAFRGSLEGGGVLTLTRARFDRFMAQVMDVVALAECEIRRLGELTSESRSFLVSMLAQYIVYFLMERIFREAFTMIPFGGTLGRCGTDLTKLAKQGKLDPVIGREKQVDQLVQILSRRSKNNACLIGDPGVGKTAVVEGLAQLIATAGDAVPPTLQRKKVIAIDMVGLLAGATYFGQFEGRMKNLLHEVKRSGNIILFIDEVHTVVGAGRHNENAIDVANIIKPALARGELQVIGATTTEEYRKYIDKDPALERRFGPVTVPEPTVEETTGILTGLRQRYEKHHAVHYSDQALSAAADLSHKYISGRFLPDKAIDLIDQAGSIVSLRHAAQAKQLRDRELELKSLMMDNKGCKQEMTNDDESSLEEPPVVTEEDVRHVVSVWSGVPVQKLSVDETNKLLTMEEALHARVVGQHEAVTAISRAIRRARAGLNEPDKPIGSFVFAGPTGVGKTELAKALAAFYYGSEDAMVRLDMSEFTDKHTVSRLVGAPPGYDGYSEGGQLTEAVRRRPHTVVLLDEVEKAHPDVFDVMLQVLDDGRLTDGTGRTVDFTNTLVIMTSNIGAGGRLLHDDKIKELVGEQMKRHFRPEFLNRIDETIVFKQLTKAEVREIATIMLSHVAGRVRKKGIQLQVTDKLKDLVVEEGFDPSYGARPLKRAILRLLEDPLADKMLAGEIKPGDSVTVDIDSCSAGRIKMIVDQALA